MKIFTLLSAGIRAEKGKTKDKPVYLLPLAGLFGERRAFLVDYLTVTRKP